MKYPMLALYQTLMIGIGIVLIGGGILLGIGAGQAYRPFNFQAFATTAIIPSAFGIAFLVFAELISVFVRVENHLDEMKRLLQRQERAEVYAARSVSASDSVAVTTPSASYPTPTNNHRATVKSVEAPVRKSPNLDSPVGMALSRNTQITLIGKSADGQWVCLDAKSWIEVADLDLKDGLSSLPYFSN